MCVTRLSARRWWYRGYEGKAITPLLCTPPQHDRSHHMNVIDHRGPWYRHRTAERGATPHPMQGCLRALLAYFRGADLTPQPN